MILDQISFLDCLAFVIFLAPQLFIQVGALATFKCLFQIIPFFLGQLPYQLLTIDILTPREKRPPYHARAPFFTSLVIRCVRYAFANLPAPIGRVFFSKPVALPFARFRMLRHGYWPYSSKPLSTGGKGSVQQHSRAAKLAYSAGFKPIDCHFEEKTLEGGVKGLWLTKDPSRAPDVVVYYLHGGGFSMGSPWFYLEFLMAWMDLLSQKASIFSAVDGEKAGSDSANVDGKADEGKVYSNPALFALDYTLVPAATFPTQLEQTLTGYDYVLSTLPDSPDLPIELAGDSAGATLALSLLLQLSSGDSFTNQQQRPLRKHATLMSPWCRLVSPLNGDTPSDFLNREALHLYARQYVGAVSGSISDKRQQIDGGSGAGRERKVNASGNPVRLKRVRGTDANRGLEMTDREKTTNPLASPGDCLDDDWWRRAVPAGGVHFVHGASEAFAPESRNLAARIKKALEHDGKGRETRREVRVTEEPAQIHAWPVVALFLGQGRRERLAGLSGIVGEMRAKIQDS